MFRIQGLDPDGFAYLRNLNDAELALCGARRHIVTAKPGFPDRIAVRDLEIRDTAILLHYEHHAVETPYRASHAIFIDQNAPQALDLIDTVPDALRIRPISLRAFTASGEMIDADLADGTALVPLIARFFANPEVDYLHAHYAKYGCYAARITRA